MKVRLKWAHGYVNFNNIVRYCNNNGRTFGVRVMCLWSCNVWHMCFVTTSPGQPDEELPASAAIRQSSSDANHLHRPPLLPLLCGIPVHGCIHRLEVRGTWPILTIINFDTTITAWNYFYKNKQQYQFMTHAALFTSTQFCFVHLVLLCRLTPSEQCGPFRGLNNTFSVVGVWIDDLGGIPGSQWVVWIYQNVIRSEIFYFLISLIIM